ncbi:tyrosine-type recombinase/integrase [Nocardioides cheoyonin]|uniref:tyrosine-type recombinase/integrase n=1 Tax=Nocardioides cheoyonin TaxID=3156615 RepID=UPI0032B395A0
MTAEHLPATVPMALPDVRAAAIVSPPRGFPLSRTAEAYLAGRNDSTVAAYRRGLASWEAWLLALGVEAGEARPEHMRRWIAHLKDAGLSASTINQRVAAVNGLYAWGRENGLTDANPTLAKGTGLRQQESATRRLGLAPREVHRLIETAKIDARRDGGRGAAFVALLAGCGLRVSEATGADTSALSESHGRRVLRVVGKRDKIREVAIPAGGWHLLTEYMADRLQEDHEPLFLTRTGKRWTRTEAHDYLRRLGRRAGLDRDLFPHLLRHTAATTALDKGAPLDTVQHMLGHASPATTGVYTRARQSVLYSPTEAIFSAYEQAEEPE